MIARRNCEENIYCRLPSGSNVTTSSECQRDVSTVFEFGELYFVSYKNKIQERESLWALCFNIYFVFLVFFFLWHWVNFTCRITHSTNRILYFNFKALFFINACSYILVLLVLDIQQLSMQSVSWFCLYQVKWQAEFKKNVVASSMCRYVFIRTASSFRSKIRRVRFRKKFDWKAFHQISPENVSHSV